MKPAKVYDLTAERIRRTPAIAEARRQALYAIIMADADTWMAEHFPVEGAECSQKKNG